MAGNGTNTCNTCQAPISFRKDEENDKWLRFNLDGTPHTHERKPGGGGRAGRSEGELHDIRREAVLKAAVAYVVGKAQASDPETVKQITANAVIQTAKVFLAFVEEGRPSNFLGQKQ